MTPELEETMARLILHSHQVILRECGGVAAPAGRA
jgi:hypothetical protein